MINKQTFWTVVATVLGCVLLGILGAISARAYQSEDWTMFTLALTGAVIFLAMYCTVLYLRQR